jgi:hypothetical protein
MQIISEEQKKYVQLSAQKEMKKALDVRNSIEKNKMKLQSDTAISKWEIPASVESDNSFSSLLVQLKAKSLDSQVTNSSSFLHF